MLKLWNANCNIFPIDFYAISRNDRRQRTKNVNFYKFSPWRQGDKGFGGTAVSRLSINSHFVAHVPRHLGARAPPLRPPHLPLDILPDHVWVNEWGVAGAALIVDCRFNLQLASNAWPLILGLQMPHVRKVMLQNFIFF